DPAAKYRFELLPLRGGELFPEHARLAVEREIERAQQQVKRLVVRVRGHLAEREVFAGVELFRKRQPLARRAQRRRREGISRTSGHRARPRARGFEYGPGNSTDRPRISNSSGNPSAGASRRSCRKRNTRAAAASPPRRAAAAARTCAGPGGAGARYPRQKRGRT